ncbi:hypothetical protein ACIRVK_13425 [Streptomyces sp. NPDC101152]|uniref:hypothetical protein n=1 Tax=Streptomyces sp. NPDC101152 TaxID=3366116 RepID=UPI0037FDA317
MCPNCEDFVVTVAMLGQLALYAETPGADLDFADVVGNALALSLPEPPPGLFPPGDGPEFPGEGWTP